MCAANKIARSKTGGQPGRQNQIGLVINKWITLRRKQRDYEQQKNHHFSRQLLHSSKRCFHDILLRYDP